MKSFKNFVTENISQEDIERIRRMMTADPVTARRLQSELESTRQAAERISGGKTRTSQTGQRTRTRPSARNTPAGRAADAEFFKRLEIGTEQGAAAENQAAQDMKAEVKRKRPTSSKPKTSSGLADLNREIDKVKPKVTTRRGRLSSQADDVLKGLRTQAGLEKRMSAGYDRTLVRRGEEVLKQIRSDSKLPKPPKPTTYRNLGLGPETVGRSFDVKRVRASAPVRAPRSQRYSNLGLGQERAGQRVVNRPVEIRVKPQPKTQLPKTQLLKPPGTSSTAVADKVVKQMQDAAKKKSASNVRTLSRIGKGLGAVGAGLEAQGEYMRRKDLGQDTSTAVTGAATRTSGGIGGAAIGGKLGAKFGSVFGPKGALLGGTAGSIYGYMVGADKATQAFDNISKGGSKGFAKGLVDFASFRKKASSAK